ncbi:MAG: YdbL family protein [Panacagrimonas sp.]
MNRSLALLSAAFAFLVAACVTINVYFPAAAAQAAADRVIDEVWGGQTLPAAKPPAAPSALPKNPSPPPTSMRDASEVRTLAIALLDFVVPAARAEEPNVDISSPEIKRLTDSMEARFKDLGPYLDSGAVGIGFDGFVALHDANVVPLADRNKVRTLTANENADRAALYREIAQANGQPQWEEQIRGAFAQRWIARAKPGWFVQDRNAEWKQK